MIFEKFRFWLAGKILGMQITRNPETWRQVHLFEQSIKHFSTGTAFIYLFESNLGNRRYEVKCTLTDFTGLDFEAWYKSWPIVLRKIIPWLNGRFDPDIPSYNDVDSIDVIAKLSMKK